MSWHSVEEELPEDQQTVVVVANGKIGMGFIDDQGNWSVVYKPFGGEDYKVSVTHWQHLPNPPYRPKSLQEAHSEPS